MPLTSHGTALDDIEMTRRIAETLRQRSMEASKMGIDGLSLMEKMSAQARGEDRQAGLDKQASDRLVLQDRRQTASDTRQAGLDATAAAERKATKLRLEKADTAAAQKAAEAANWQMSEAGRDQGNRDRQYALDERKLRLGRAPASAESIERQRVKDATAAAKLAKLDAAAAPSTGEPLTKGTVGSDITKRARSLEGAARSLDALERKYADLEANTTLPATGPIATPVRDLIDWLPGLPGIDVVNTKERTELAAEMANLSAQTWALTGRTDAPSNTEGAETGPIKFTGKETPEQFSAKVSQIREQVKRARESLRTEALGLNFRPSDVDAVLPGGQPAPVSASSTFTSDDEEELRRLQEEEEADQ